MGEKLDDVRLDIQRRLNDLGPAISYFGDGRQNHAVVYHELNLTDERHALAAPCISDRHIQVCDAEYQHSKPEQPKERRCYRAVPRSTASTREPSLLVVTSLASATHETCVAI